MVRRSKIELLRDVLRVLKQDGGAKKTEVVYKANLNFERASKILSWLVEKDLAEIKSNRYEITEKGEEVLKSIDKLASDLGF